MKKIALYSLCLVLFFCSKDEETQAPTNTVQTTTPEPVVTQYTLTVTASEGGSVSSGGTFDDGTSVSVSATANEGYEFIGWEGSDETINNISIILNADTSLNALFRAVVVVQYTLTITAGDGGSVTDGGTYDEGTEVTITATANDGYQFIGWEESASVSETLIITLDSNKTYQALFELIPLNILFISGDGGSIKITGENIDEQGVELSNAINQTEISVEAIPEPGYIFAGWISNSGATFSAGKLEFPSYYQFLNSNNNITLNASFVEAPPNPISELDITNLEGIQGRDGYNFYYNISDNLPIDWINEFKIIMGNLNSVVHITPRVKTSPRDGKDEMHIFAWNSNEESPFTAIIGNYGGACICGNQYGSYMVLEINSNEFIYNQIHRYSVIAHEYFHAYQINASIVEPPYLKYLFEGGAATFESLYIQQYYNINYFLDAQTSVSQLAIDSPILFETFNDDVSEINYSDSVFIFLALVKEIQKQGNTEIQAFKKVYVNWWKSGRTDVTKEVLFEEVFGFSIDSFYLALKSYNPNINSILPSQSIRLQDIFTE